MLEIASSELLFGILLVSFFSGLFFLLSSIILLFITETIRKRIKKYPNREDLKVILRRGYYLSTIAFLFALFFGARIVIAVQANVDFTAKQWLFFDMFMSIFIFVKSTYTLSLLNAIKNS